MSHIEDLALFKAVSFASAMRKKGKSIQLACKIAGEYYGVSIKDVASQLGKRGAMVSRSKKQTR